MLASLHTHKCIYVTFVKKRTLLLVLSDLGGGGRKIEGPSLFDGLRHAPDVLLEHVGHLREVGDVGVVARAQMY